MAGQGRSTHPWSWIKCSLPPHFPSGVTSPLFPCPVFPSDSIWEGPCRPHWASLPEWEGCHSPDPCLPGTKQAGYKALAASRPGCTVRGSLGPGLGLRLPALHVTASQADLASQAPSCKSSQTLSCPPLPSPFSQPDCTLLADKQIQQ